MNKKSIFALILIIIILLSVGFLYAIQSINSFFDKNELSFNQVLKIDLKAPIEVKKRLPIIQREILNYPTELIDTPIKKYVCDKFGALDCKIALSIIQAESGFREDAIGINTNHTVDLGLFQINTVHFKQDGCSPKELLDAQKNVDCAYNIYKASGWSVWTTFKDGRYLFNL